MRPAHCSYVTRAKRNAKSLLEEAAHLEVLHVY
jgi:hypothetical protein